MRQKNLRLGHSHCLLYSLSDFGKIFVLSHLHRQQEEVGTYGAVCHFYCVCRSKHSLLLYLQMA